MSQEKIVNCNKYGAFAELEPIEIFGLGIVGWKVICANRTTNFVVAKTKFEAIKEWNKKQREGE